MFKKWSYYIGQYKRHTLFTLISVTFEVAIDIIIPHIMANIIDKGINDGNMDVVTKTGLTMILMCLCSLISGFLAGHFAAYASSGFAKNLREDIFEKIQEFSFTKIDKFSTSGLITRLTTDVSNVQISFQLIIRTCIRSPLMIICAMIMVFSINKKLAIIFITIFPILALGLGFIISKAHPIFTRVFKMYDNLNNVVEEDLRGIRVVKSYVCEEYETNKFKNISNNIYNNFVTAERILAFNNPLMQLCMYTCTLLICWLGAKFIVSNKFTIGQLMSLMAYATQILISLTILSMVFVMITMSRASMQRIGEVLNEENDMLNGEVTNVNNGTIIFDNVSFGYRGKNGKLSLQNININIKAGQTIGIIGGTGSGKSTLVQLIPRLYDATDGKITINDIDIRKYDIKALREKVAMVLQKNVLFSGTVRENLLWGNKNATDEELDHACRVSQSYEFISVLPDKYDSRIEQGGKNFSGGQRQRLCIARALLKRANILILDDSTSAVDTKTEDSIRKALHKESPHMTKIIVAQRISSVQDADQIIVMDNGQINGIGTHNELLNSNNIYKEVYLSQEKKESGPNAS